MLIKKSKIIFFFSGGGGGGGASEIRQTWGGACPKRLKTPGLGPKYIADILTEYKPNRPLRSLGSSQLEIPRVHTKQGESAFSYYAARSWNQLPEEIRCAKNISHI